MAVHIFIDTSVLMEFRRPDEIAWTALADVDSVVLVVAPQVQSEIDNHKRADSRRKRRRAETLIRWFREIKDRSNVVTDGVRMEFLFVEPRRFEEHDLDPSVPDDRIIAALLAYRAASGGVHVAITTGDFGMQQKAEARGIQVIVVPEEYRLEPEPDPELAELTKENAELRRLTNRRPQLGIAFAGGQLHFAAELQPSPEPSIAEIEAELEYEREKVKSLDGLGAVVTILGLSPASTDAQRAKDHDEHLRELKQHLVASAERRAVESRTFSATLIVSNKGTAPAKNIDVKFATPQGVALRSKPIFPNVPERPEYPPVIAALRRFQSHAFVSRAFAGRFAKVDGFFDAATRWHILHLRHGAEERLELHVQLDVKHDLRGFSISVEIHSDDLIEPIRSALHFKLTAA